MALKLDGAVERGELDNTQQGRVRAVLRFVGREEPVTLDLEGDPWRDLAGLRITFENPAPHPQEEALSLAAIQSGCVGDITAATRLAMPDGTRFPVFYLEWFSVTEGRCLIEGAGYSVAVVSGPSWQMDEDEEGAQKLANLQAMRTHLEGIIQRPERPLAGEDDLTEEAAEQQLRETDRMMVAYMEASEKFGPQSDLDGGDDTKLCFVMGWDNLLDFSASAQEGAGAGIEADSSADLEDLGEADDEDDDIEVELEAFDLADPPHPLKEASSDLVLRLIREMRAAGLDGPAGEAEDALDRFISRVMEISGKLAGVLGPPPGSDLALHEGYVLAVSRRCLNWANQALAALEELLHLPHHAPHRSMFEGWRKDLFKLREGIADLRRETREGSAE